MEAATDEGFREDDHTPNNLTKIGESIATRRPNTDIAHEGELFEWPLWLSAWSAAANGDVIGLLRLVEAQPGIANVKSTIGWTPLHFACARGHAKITRLLLERGAVSVPDLTSSAATPFSLAVAAKHRACAKLVMETGHVGTAEAARHLAAARGDKDYITVDIIMRWQARTGKPRDVDGLGGGLCSDGQPNAVARDGNQAPSALHLDPCVVDVLRGEIAHFFNGQTVFSKEGGGENGEVLEEWAGEAARPAHNGNATRALLTTTDVLQVLLNRAEAERDAQARSYAAKPVDTWTPAELGSWVINEFGLGAAANDIDFAIRHSCVSGRVVQALKRAELMALLRALGVPPLHRRRIAVEMALLSDSDATERLKMADTRDVPLAIVPETHTNCTEWRIVGSIAVSLLEPLSTVRTIISNTPALSGTTTTLGCLPGKFVFLSRRKKRNAAVRREEEGVSVLGTVGPLPILLVQKERRGDKIV